MQKQNKASETLKKALTSKLVIKIFDPKKEVTLTDASKHTIAVIVSQEGHLIMYLSKKLSSAECYYSNIEKEALAIVWSMKRAQNFLLGKKFLLKSDHNPLEFLFYLRKELPRETLSRILRWAIKLPVFDFDIIYVKGNTIPHVDTLSRLRFQSENGEEHENSEDWIIQWVETDVLSRKALNKETQQEPILSWMLECIRKNVWSNCTIVERPFKEAWPKLTVERGIIFSADTIVLPQILRKDIIKNMHDNIYARVTAPQRRLRLQAWW